MGVTAQEIVTSVPAQRFVTCSDAIESVFLSL